MVGVGFDTTLGGVVGGVVVVGARSLEVYATASRAFETGMKLTPRNANAAMRADLMRIIPLPVRREDHLHVQLVRLPPRSYKLSLKNAIKHLDFVEDKIVRFSTIRSSATTK